MSNCSNLGAFKDITTLYQKQPGDADGGHHTIPLSQDDGLFVSDLSFWDASVEFVQTYKRTSDYLSRQLHTTRV